jgi:ribosomal protein S18 acetylase RimI-like enzyme
MNIEISEATELDAPGIALVAKAVKYKPGKGQRGFLIHVKSEEEYGERIRLSKHFFVAREGGKAIGFLMAYDKNELVLLKEKLSHEDSVAGELLCQECADFIFIDQVAVLPEYHDRGVGQLLLDKVSDKPALFACILHKPTLNTRSRAFFVEKNNWRLVKEIRQGGLIWGLYTNR